MYTLGGGLVSRRDNTVSTYLSDDEKAELSRFVSETDESQATVVRNALLEYLDFDRYHRVESQVRKNGDKLDKVLSLLNSDQHTHTSDHVPETRRASSTVEKVRAVASRIYDNHEMPIKTSDVNRAIEDIAGADDRTLEKYRSLLKERQLLFAHPSESPVWTDEKQEWAGWVESYVDATPSAEVYDFAEPHGMGTEEYQQIAEVKI